MEHKKQEKERYPLTYTQTHATPQKKKKEEEATKNSKHCGLLKLLVR